MRRAGGAIGPHGPGQPGGPRVRLVPGALEVAEIAGRCRTWDEVAAGSQRCTACPELAATRTTVVVGDLPRRPAGSGPPGNGPESGPAESEPPDAGPGSDPVGTGPWSGPVGPGPAGSGPAGSGPPGAGPGSGPVEPGVRRPLLALVGEAPGAEEDRAGRPFVGRAGRLLDELLAEAGLPRAEVAVLNVLQCRPTVSSRARGALANRTPAPDEVARCRGWLLRKLDLLRPDLVCTLGLTAATWFLGRRVTLAAERGRLHQVDGRRVVVTYHPSAAIRYGPAGAPRAALLADLRLAVAFLGESTPDDLAGTVRS